MTGTAVESDVFRAAFTRLESRTAAGDPTWLRTTRQAAFERFATLGFPTTRIEEWRFTSVAAIARTPFRPASDNGAAPVAAEALAPWRLGGFEGRLAVFVDGRFSPALSSLGALPQGIEVLSLREALRRQPERLEPHLTRIATDARNPFTALNTAFLEDGAAVFVAPGTLAAEPVQLLFFGTRSGGGEPAAAHPRNLVVAGRGSMATIVQTWAGPQGETYFTNAVTEVVLEDDAVVDHYELQAQSEAAFHVATLAVRQGRSSRFSNHAIALGGALARNDIGVVLGGEGGECALRGLFMPRGQQHMDAHTLIDHAQPHCTSREVYKGVLDGRARGVFHGKILVREGAQKTDAYQANKNLLLSREALVNSTPALEIHADDVKCKHGSTTGQLDEAAIFYLRSRGLDEQAARSLLTCAFAGEIVRGVKIEPLRAALDAALLERLPGAAEVKEAVA
jgi:Fe-S cluster assembly protein SufD